MSRRTLFIHRTLKAWTIYVWFHSKKYLKSQLYSTSRTCIAPAQQIQTRNTFGLRKAWQNFGANGPHEQGHSLSEPKSLSMDASNLPWETSNVRSAESPTLPVSSGNTNPSKARSETMQSLQCFYQNTILKLQTTTDWAAVGQKCHVGLHMNQDH